MHSLLSDIGLSSILAAVLGTSMYRLKQPTILGYFIAGALLGPGIGFGWVHDAESIEVISEIGLILLLFVIGLEMNLADLASAGKQLAIAGIGQFLFCALLGFGFFSLYSLSGAEGSMGALYAALLCALSSTAVVVKILYDKFELETRAGRLTLGVLVIQDLWAILVLAFQPNFANPEISLIAIALGKSAALVALSYFISKFILRSVVERTCKSPEIVVLISIGWCAAMAALAAWYGLSKEMGALIAGAAISAFPYRIHVIAKTLPLRDFFLTLFFVSLGMKLVSPSMEIVLGASIVVAFVILSRLIVVYPLVRVAGGGQRTAFVTSINLAQLSEFALVIAALGVSYRHVSDSFVALMIYAMAASAMISSYALKYNHQIFNLIARLVRLYSDKNDQGDLGAPKKAHRDIVILGFHFSGRNLIESLTSRHPEILPRIQVVDFNVEALRELEGSPVKPIFGDISSFDTLHHAHLEHAKYIICTLPDILLKGTSNEQIAETCRALAPQAEIFVVADGPEHRDNLISAGATDAILWYRGKAEALAGLLLETEAVKAAE